MPPPDAVLLHANTLHIPLTDQSVHMVLTSPPYWGLRSYGIGAAQGELGREPLHDCLGWATGANCGTCYLCHMRTVMRECWRVVRDEGVVFLNLGDSYASSRQRRPHGPVKPKDLCLIPQRLALALQADGWTVRSDIVWHKPSAMPQRVHDRPTSAHEYVWLLTKRPRYFYDGDAGREAAINGPPLRSVWTMTSEPLPHPCGHTATFPSALACRCILVGTSAHGVCRTCGKPWERVVERQRVLDGAIPVSGAFGRPEDPYRMPPTGKGHGRYSTVTSTLGWRPTCPHHEAPVIPATVLDPFVGSGTTVLAAYALGRHSVGLDLSLAYLQTIAQPRLVAAITAEHECQAARDAQPDLFVPPTPRWRQQPLFGAT